MSPHISIKGETIFELYGFPVTNSFIVTLVVVVLFSFIARYYYVQIHKKDRSLLFYALHSMFTGIYGMLESVLGAKISIFYSLLGAFFFFILMLNWSGLIPGVGSILIKPQVHEKEVEVETIADTESVEVMVEDNSPIAEVHEEVEQISEPIEESSDSVEAVPVEEDAHAESSADKEIHRVPLLRGGTADLNTTIALALVSVFMTQLYGFRFLGPIKHLRKYFDFRDPIMIMLGPLELIQEFARIISFGFRLYGNIFAGEVLLTIVPFLLPVFFSFVVAPMFLMEIFVGLVQALVFVMLSAVFINMATTAHH